MSMVGIVRTFLMATALVMGSVCTAQALPKNFRNVDTFYVGAMPSVNDMIEFRDLGIKTIISLHQLPPETKKAAKKYGITTYSFPLRTRLQHIDKIMEIMREAPAHTVYLHCLHGADRTGAVTAYWLTNERQVDPFVALLSVLSPKEIHIKGLYELGNEYGFSMQRVEPDKVGRYSGARNGGLEGLKICGDTWYTRLARNFLMLTVGEPTHEKNERFWHKYNKNEENGRR